MPKKVALLLGILNLAFVGVAFAQAVPTANFSMTATGAGAVGTSTNSFTVGQSWTISVTSDMPGQNFSLCSIDNNGTQSCTPWALTDGNGSWTGTGSFAASTVGSWTEWITFPSENISSNRVTFTVSPIGTAPSVTPIAPSTDPLISTGSSAGTSSGVGVVSCDEASVSAAVSELQNLAQSLSGENVPSYVITAAQGVLNALANSAEQLINVCATAAGNGTASGSSGAGNSSTSGSAPTATTFPVTILVIVPQLNVRSAPSTTAALAGSQTLYAGNEFTAVNEVTGESVNGNDLWWVSSQGNYVWSGGTEIAASSATSGTGAGAGTGTGSGAITKTPHGTTTGKSVTKTVEDAQGNSYTVNYSFTSAGEVQASFSYEGGPAALNGLSFIAALEPSNEVSGSQGTASMAIYEIVSVQSDGSLRPYAQNNFNDYSFLTALEANAPTPENIYSGYAFETPLVTNHQIDSDTYAPFPANLYGITSAPTYALNQIQAANVPAYASIEGHPENGVPIYFYLTTDAGGNVTAVQPATISNQGVVTTEAVITVESPGTIAAEQYVSSNNLTNASIVTLNTGSCEVLNNGGIAQIFSASGNPEITTPAAPTMSHAALQSALLQADGFDAEVQIAQSAGYIVELDATSTTSDVESAIIRDPQSGIEVAAIGQDSD